MTKSKPLATPLQAAARPREAAADISTNSGCLRINICRLRKTAPLAPTMTGTILMVHLKEFNSAVMVSSGSSTKPAPGAISSSFQTTRGPGRPFAGCHRRNDEAPSAIRDRRDRAKLRHVHSSIVGATDIRCENGYGTATIKRLVSK